MQYVETVTRVMLQNTKTIVIKKKVKYKGNNKMKNNFKILGKKVLPLVKMQYYDASNEPGGSALCYINDPNERVTAVKHMMKQKKLELKKHYKEQEWIVWGVFADDTFELISDMGYTEKGVKRNDFRLIKNQ